MFDEKISSIKTSNHSITPNLDWYGTKTRVEFNGSCLKKGEVTFNHGKIVNIYIVYELSMFHVGRFFMLVNCLFGAVSLTENADIDKYGIGFDKGGSFLFPVGGFGSYVMIFGVDMSSSVHVDNDGKDLLILGKCPTQGLGEHLLTAENVLD